MGLNISIDSPDFARVKKLLLSLKGDVVKRVAKAAVNNSANKTRSFISTVIRERFNIKKSDLFGRFTFIRGKKVRTGAIITRRLFQGTASSLGDISSSVTVSGRRPTLLRFIVGKKEAENQRGIPIKSRRVLKAKVTKGRVTRLKRSFIQKGKSAGNIVFQRIGKGKGQIVPRTITPFSKFIFKRQRNLNRVEKFRRKTFEKETIRLMRLSIKRGLPSSIK